MTTDERMEICKKCPLYLSNEFGIVCNSGLYMNDNGKVSSFKKPGYHIRGCNCKLDIKTKNPEAHCVAGKW